MQETSTESDKSCSIEASKVVLETVLHNDDDGWLKPLGKTSKIDSKPDALPSTSCRESVIQKLSSPSEILQSEEDRVESNAIEDMFDDPNDLDLLDQDPNIESGNLNDRLNEDPNQSDMFNEDSNDMLNDDPNVGSDRVTDTSTFNPNVESLESNMSNSNKDSDDMLNEDPNVDLDMFKEDANSVIKSDFTYDDIDEEEVDKWITEKENLPAKTSPKVEHKTANTSAFEDDFYDDLDDSVCEEWLNQNEKSVYEKSRTNSQSTSNVRQNKSNSNLAMSQSKVKNLQSTSNVGPNNSNSNLVLSQSKKTTNLIGSFSKSGRRGVQFSDEEDSQTDESNSQNKYEQIIERNKRKLESPVITNKKMKSKMKKNSLFR